MAGIRWERLPLARALPPARDWLLGEAEAGLSATTVAAYSRAVEGYLAYCRERRIEPCAATSEHVAAYLGEFGEAARRQRLTAIRLFYAYVVERGGRADNPAGRAASASGVPLLGAARPPGERLPWVPDEGAWLGLLEAASAERSRTRVMLALAYDAALRREELCRLRVADLDPGRRTLWVSAPGRAGRAVPLSPAIAERCAAYLRERDDGDAALFLSESPRNRARPLTIWTWSKVSREIARRAGVAGFTAHTPRHLRLTDLARAGWDAAAIARFAGHSRAGLARRYLRLAEEHPAPANRDVERRRAEQLARVLFRARR